MKVTYDPEVDVLRILFSNAPIEESDEDKPGLIIDYDKDANIVRMEIWTPPSGIDNPRQWIMRDRVKTLRVISGIKSANKGWRC